MPLRFTLLLSAWAMAAHASLAPGHTTEPRGLDQARFDAGAAHVGRVSLALASFGRASAMHAADLGADAVRTGDEVHFRRDHGVSEWWRGVDAGLEHGVTFDARPEGDGALVLEMSLGGGVRPEGSGDEVVLVDGGTDEALATYSHLVVLDADGVRVPARMAAAEARIRIEVDDGGARYPLIVDPLLVTLEQTFLPPSADADDDFGFSVALSSDGSRAVVGARYDENVTGPVDIGMVTVLHRVGTGWTGVAILRPADLEGRSHFGWSAAISGDGSRIIVGAPGDRPAGPAGAATGTARVFAWSGTAWEEEATLVHPGARDGDAFGSAVAIDVTGTRALVGAPDENEGTTIYTGGAHVFFRTGTSWAHEARFVGNASGDAFGTAVALDATASTALVGAPFGDDGTAIDCGTARVLTRTGTTWTERTTLIATGRRAYDSFGAAVSLSSDGRRALIGAPLDDIVANDSEGTARVFALSGPFWAEDAVLQAPDFAAADRFGGAVALSASGNVALVGAPGDDVGASAAGSVRLFSYGTSWVSEGILAHPGPVVPMGAIFGDAVALSGDATRALVGAAGDTGALVATAGTARVYVVRATSANGVACSTATECFSGSCVDGVCCDTTCGGGVATDCQACSVASGALVDGTCAPRAASVVCRASAAACDAEELCDGTSVACPGDARAAPGVVCRSSAGPCDVEETCNGATTTCPSDGFGSPLLICRPALAGGCDVQETCTGTSGLCPADNFMPATTGCGPAVSDVCDAPDHCAGTSADCVATFLAGVECRAAAGACDSPELCGGGSVACPPDLVESAGMACRVSTDPACDPEEVCDGASTACPADVTTCAPTPDAGPGPLDGGVVPDAGPSDAGTGVDGGAGAVDAGATPPADTGCACRVARGHTPTALAPFAAMVACALRRARRRARA